MKGQYAVLQLPADVNSFVKKTFNHKPLLLLSPTIKKIFHNNEKWIFIQPKNGFMISCQICNLHLFVI